MAQDGKDNAADCMDYANYPDYQKNLERIKRLRLLDDDFFNVCFNNDTECTQFLLRILLERDDLKVINATAQHSIKNLEGHSVILDVFATDENGIRYDIEIQRADSGALPQRARYNSSLIDAQNLPSGEDYKQLRESYVIFITENDVIGNDKPIYHIERVIKETGADFGDGSHIIYANASYRDQSRFGRLMHDLCCSDPNDMHYSILAQKTRYFKEDTEGVKGMCKIFEEIKQEGIEQGIELGRVQGIEQGRVQGIEQGRVQGIEQGRVQGKAEERENAMRRESAIKKAFRMLIDGKLTLEEIAAYTDLSLDEIKEFAAIASV